MTSLHEIDESALALTGLLSERSELQQQLAAVEMKIDVARKHLARGGLPEVPNSGRLRLIVAYEAFINADDRRIRPETLVKPFREHALLSGDSATDDDKACQSTRQFLRGLTKKGWAEGPDKSWWTITDEGLQEMAPN